MIEYQIDISDRKKAEARLHELSVTDDMTSLYNRRGFLLLAEKQVRIADRQPGELFILYADCDRLKMVNDGLGHKVGDQLIRETADVLRDTFRQADIVGPLPKEMPSRTDFTNCRSATALSAMIKAIPVPWKSCCSRRTI